MAVHKNPDLRAVTLSFKRLGQAPGDATADQLDQAAALADKFSAGELRVTHDQNLLLPWVRCDQLPELWREARKAGDAVFLTREFAHLGGEDQVLRALRGLVREGRLVRLGYGVYGRAVKSRLSGKPMLYSRDGFVGAAREALDKLGVEWEPTEAERAYNEGRSTQVPVNPVVRVKGRFRRQLRYGNAELVLER